MTQITVERTHALGRAEARERAQGLVQKLADEYELKADWQGDIVHVKRSGASGSIEIGEHVVRVQLKLGLMLSMLGGKIEKEIQKSLDKALA